MAISLLLWMPITFVKLLSKLFQKPPEGLRRPFLATLRLDVHGPKLAHYAGYELANKLLPWVVPGYREYYSQTAAYRRELEKYTEYFPISIL